MVMNFGKSNFPKFLIPLKGYRVTSPILCPHVWQQPHCPLRLDMGAGQVRGGCTHVRGLSRVHTYTLGFT